MQGVDFRETCADVCSVDRLRIVACDGKGEDWRSQDISLVVCLSVICHSLTE